MLAEYTDFQQKIYSYFQEHRREMPWRYCDDPYKILVSEIMLQQTQVERVIPKYAAFLAAFPTVKDLANATPADVLRQWVGLGYNRRGLFLKRAAEHIVSEYAGKIPNKVAAVDALPGVGYATACAVVTYSFNIPTVFIETNIRTVFIDNFFADRDNVDDKEIYPLVEATVDRNNPRDWYYALMDYGVMLKKTRGNLSRKSAHHTKQSQFEGSDRQIRGKIVRYLTSNERLPTNSFMLFDADTTRVYRVVETLVKDGVLKRLGSEYTISDA